MATYKNQIQIVIFLHVTSLVLKELLLSPTLCSFSFNIDFKYERKLDC